jgi:hypothetical protein
MRTRTMAVSMLVAAALIGTPMLAPAAMAQPVSMTSASTVVPVVLWAATGAVIGAVAWPLVAGGAAAAAAGPVGVMTVGSLLNMGALSGAFLGSAGYLLTR